MKIDKRFRARKPGFFVAWRNGEPAGSAICCLVAWFIFYAPTIDPAFIHALGNLLEWGGLA